MDSLLEIPGALGGFGALGLLVWWGLRLMRQGAEDRQGAADQLTAERAQHTKIVAEKDQLIAELQRMLEAERREKWAAQDSAAVYRRRLGLDEVDTGDRSS